jgi:hypothetical protein
MSELHPEFQPLRAPTRAGRVAVLLAGPLLWVVVLEIVAIVAGQTDLIWIGILIAAGAFLVGLVFLLFMRSQRLKQEREALREPAR